MTFKSILAIVGRGMSAKASISFFSEDGHRVKLSANRVK